MISAIVIVIVIVHHKELHEPATSVTVFPVRIN